MNSRSREQTRRVLVEGQKASRQDTVSAHRAAASTARRPHSLPVTAKNDTRLRFASPRGRCGVASIFLTRSLLRLRRSSRASALPPALLASGQGASASSSLRQKMVGWSTSISSFLALCSSKRSEVSASLQASSTSPTSSSSSFLRSGHTTSAVHL